MGRSNRSWMKWPPMPACAIATSIYGIIGDTLRGNSTADDGFTRRILERMEREGVTIDPDYDPLA